MTQTIALNYFAEITLEDRYKAWHLLFSIAAAKAQTFELYPSQETLFAILANTGEIIKVGTLFGILLPKPQAIVGNINSDFTRLVSSVVKPEQVMALVLRRGDELVFVHSENGHSVIANLDDADVKNYYSLLESAGLPQTVVTKVNP